MAAKPASAKALRITLESPVAPEEVASAASVNTTGPSIVRAWAMARDGRSGQKGGRVRGAEAGALPSARR